MAEKNVVIEQELAEDVVSKAKGFWAKYSKVITYIGSAVILLAGGWLAYKYFVKAPKEVAANESIFPAQELFKNMSNAPSFNKDTAGIVLNGGNIDGIKITGLLTIAKKYSGTATGNIANYMIGTTYLQTGDFDKAITYLKAFDGGNASQVGSAAYRMLGDAYSEKNNNEEALSNYKKAINAADSKDEATQFFALSKAALLCDAIGKNEDAITYFKKIKEDISPDFFTTNRIVFDADKYLAKLGVYK